VHVIHNGIDLDKPVQARHEIRHALALGDRPTVGIVARLAPVKNHDLLLRAWKRLLEVVPEAVLLVIGDGSQAQRLEGLRQDLALGNSVRFLGFRNDVSELLQALDVFVLCSLSEGLSLTLLEASSMGIPIVATDVGGNPEVVKDGMNGILVASESEIELANSLARLLQDRSLQERFGASGRTRHQQAFTLYAMVRGYATLYRELVGACGRRRNPSGDTALTEGSG